MTRVVATAGFTTAGLTTAALTGAVARCTGACTVGEYAGRATAVAFFAAACGATFDFFAGATGVVVARDWEQTSMSVGIKTRIR